MIRIAICFRCDQFGIWVGGGVYAPYVNADDILDFMRPSVVALAKSVYPNDSEIQALKPELWQ